MSKIKGNLLETTKKQMSYNQRATEKEDNVWGRLNKLDAIKAAIGGKKERYLKKQSNGKTRNITN